MGCERVVDFLTILRARSLHLVVVEGKHHATSGKSISPLSSFLSSTLAPFVAAWPPGTITASKSSEMRLRRAQVGLHFALMRTEHLGPVGADHLHVGASLPQPVKG